MLGSVQPTISEINMAQNQRNSRNRADSIHRGVLKVLRTFALPFALSCMSIMLVHGQVQGDVTPTFQVTDPVVSDGVDKIDVTAAYNQFGLTVDIPLISYPQVGGVLDLGFSLHYEPLTSRPIGYSGLNLLEKSRGGWYIVETGNRAVGDYGASLSTISPAPTQTFENYGIRVMSPSGAVDYMAFDGTNYDSINATGMSFALSPNITSLSNYYNGAYGTILKPNGINITTVAPNPTGYNCPGHVQVADINCESPQRTDPNGNSITFSASSGWTDTAGRHIPLPVSAPTSDCPSGPQPVVYALQWSFPGYNGGTYPVLICYINTDSQAGATLSQYGLFPFVTSLIQTVVLPNNSSWQFTYGQGVSSSPSGTSCNVLTELTYPSGATTSYTYSQGCVWATHPGGGLVVPPELGIRSVDANDGTGSHQWTYVTNEPASSQANTSPVINTITDADKNDTVYTMSNEVPESSTGQMQTVPGGWVNSEIDLYQGTGSSRTLLKSQINNYISSGYYVLAGYAYPGACPIGTNCNNEYGSNGIYSWYPENGMNVVLQNEQTVLAGGLTSEVDYTYDTAPLCLLPASGTSCAPLTFGRIISKKEYDFGQGTKGTLLRTTSYTYQDQVNSKYLSAHILSLVQAETIYNGSGGTVASGTYGYDENNGSPQGVFGNRTSVNQWLNTTGGTIAAKTIYSTSGMPMQQIDPMQNSTKIAYDLTGIFPHQITHPQTESIQHIEYYTYDATTGLMTSHTDENSQTTKYAYSDPLFRMTSVEGAVNTPAESWVTYSYPTLTQVNSAQDQIAKGDGLIKTTVITDGFGKPLHSQITSDASGTVNTDIVYDGDGREYTASNQYRSTLEPTYGNRTYIYDGIGRPTQQIDSDGVSSRTWTYVGNLVKYTDENNNQWQRTYDALGRMTKIVEPGSLVTLYSYDALDNLLTVNQLGNAANGDAPRMRSFNYDSLSRLLCSSNPENSTAACPTTGTGAYVAGTTGYSYDANGNQITKTSPAVNSTTGTQTIGYCYDSLNRMTYRVSTGSFSCTSPSGYSASYSYDSSSVSGATNVIGRLTDEQSFAGGTLVAERKPYAYDPMGRLLNEQQYTLASEASGTPYSPAYTYNLAGNLTSSTSGVGPTSTSTPIAFTSTFDGAGRLQTVTSNWVDGTHPMSLFSAQTAQTTPCSNSLSVPYTAFGGLMNAVYGGGLTLNRAFDKRMRTTCEIDTGTGAAPATSGSATVTITGAEQSK